MNIIINGKPIICEASASLEQLLDLLAIDSRKIAVERNLSIVPKSTFASTLLAEGDVIEIVNFVGGG